MVGPSGWSIGWWIHEFLPVLYSEQGSATVCLTQFEYFNGGISQC